MAATASSGGEATGLGVSNQLASLVPSFDPGVDDLLIYQQKVELVYAAWPRAKTTELVTRLILGCKGSAFAKLQLHQAELLDGSEKSVQRLVELLGGSWGKIPLELQYQDAERALFETVQKADEANDSYLARADVLWSRLLSRKMSLEDLQAYILLRGSLLSSEEKKKVILEPEQDGKLSVKRVTTAIRTLGANFFMDLTNQKKTARTKIYDQTALYSESIPEAEEPDQAFQVQDDITEEEYIDQLVEQGDADALLVSDFELAAQDAIQDDSDLAVALTSYQQARHRLSEKFRNRGFFPNRPFAGSGKGKFQAGKGFNKGKQSPNWNARPRRSLQERIMQSTCRLCNQKGHWKAECPMRNQFQSGASSMSGSSTAPTTHVTADHQDVSSLPMEFLNLPEDFAESLDAVEEPLPSPSTCFVSCGIQGYHRNGHEGLILGKKSQISNHPMWKDPALVHARERIRSRVRSDGLRGLELRSSHFASPTKQPCQSHFAKGVKRTPTTEKDPVVPSKPNAMPMQCILFATHGTHGILDSGASKTVIGSQHVAELIDGLDEVIRSKITRVKCAVTFKFGNEGTLQSTQALVLPIGPLKLKIAVVPGGTPFLVSNTLLRALRAIINYQTKTVSSPMLQHEIPLELTSKGLFLIDINAVAMAAKPILDQLGSQNLSTFAMTSCKSAEVHVADQVDSKQMTNHRQSHEPQQEFYSVFDGVHDDDTVTADHEDNEPSPMHVHPPAVSEPSQKKAPLAESNDQDSEGHVVESTPEAVADGGRDGSSGRQPLEAGGPPRPTSGVWRQAPGRELQDSLEGTGLDSVYGEPLQQQSEAVPQKVDSVCGTHGITSRGKWHTHPNATDSPRIGNIESKTGGTQSNHAAKGQSNATHRSALRSSAFVRHGSRMGVRFTDVPTWVYGESSGPGHPSNADPSPQHGECSGQSHPSPRESSLSQHDRGGGGPECSLVSWDDTVDVNTMVHPDVQSLWKHVHTIQQELNHAMQNHKPIGRPFMLAEVFCSDQSPLTQQVHQMGHTAFRFGLEQGDLSRSTDRAKLFQKIVVHQPKHVWFSPVCGPWSSWSNLNAARSELSQQEYLEKRKQVLYQIALGIVLYRHQVQLGRHFHWEQPARSLMFHQPGISEIHRYTRACQFDSCEVGNLVDPQNGKFMKKGMTVLTTSPSLYKSLHGRTCRRNHDHQSIEGQTKWNGQSIRRTVYTEVYPRKFARLIAQCMCKSLREWPFQWKSGMIALTSMTTGC